MDCVAQSWNLLNDGGRLDKPRPRLLAETKRYVNQPVGQLWRPWMVLSVADDMSSNYFQWLPIIDDAYPFLFTTRPV